MRVIYTTVYYFALMIFHYTAYSSWYPSISMAGGFAWWLEELHHNQGVMFTRGSGRSRAVGPGSCRHRADGEGRRAQGRSSQSCFSPAAQQVHWLHNYSRGANKARGICCVHCPPDNRAQTWNDWSLTYLWLKQNPLKKMLLMNDAYCLHH